MATRPTYTVLLLDFDVGRIDKFAKSYVGTVNYKNVDTTKPKLQKYVVTYELHQTNTVMYTYTYL